MKTVIVCFFILFSQTFAQDLIWEPTFINAKYKALKQDKLIMIMYSKENCIECEYMEEITFKDAKIIYYLQRYFVLLKRDINYDKPIKNLSAYGTPTFYFLKSSGEIIGRHLVGGFEEKTFLKNLREYKKKSTK